MFWLSFRQFRTQALVASAVLAALALVVLIGGSQMLHAYHDAVGSRTLNDFVNQHRSMGEWLSGVVLVVPGLIGIFWGAPLVARELESGTFRLAWTQSISRTRWTLCKLGLLGLAGMAVAGLCSVLVTWWASPLDLAVGNGPFAHFDVRGVVPVAYAAFAFSLGVAAGAIIPVHDTAWKFGKPASAMAGTSGASGERVLLETPSIRTRPARAWGKASDMGANIAGMCPAIRSVMAGAVPR